MGKLLIKDIGKLVSGDLSQPILEADAILIEDGLIKGLGKGKDLEAPDVDRVIDVGGMTVAPGLIDSHCHPVIGDFTPRQRQLDFIASSLHGGVTTMISAGEVHTPGRPRDAAGTKALAILAAKAFANFRPGGVKVLGGGLILEPGLGEEDFAEMAREGVTHVGEIGLGAVKRPEDAAPMVRLAKKYGMVVMMHTGGTSIPGSTTVTADQVMATGPDVVAHLNGGPTAVPLAEAERIIKETNYAFEIVECGNPKVALEIVRIAREQGVFERILIGNDAPSGTGVIPLGILRVLNLIASVGSVKAEEAIAMATGNTARVYKLNRGQIKEGYEADLVVMDTPMGSVGADALEAIEAGDIPGIAAVLVDGEVNAWVSRNTPPPVRRCKEE
ncbi:MAG: amidohydrolase family protein [Deltaproteobacteria bacterium]|nr:amidohydrolase family protein [Deltaproteobacteria bacterium]